MLTSQSLFSIRAVTWKVNMGGHDDEDMPYVVNKQKQDEELKNKLNDSTLWCDQESTGNNAKWVKEGRNQLRKVAENQQDQDHNCNISQNGNKEDFPHQNTTQEEQQGNEDPKIAMTPGLSEEESKNILYQPKLIDTLESTEEKEREEDVKEKDKTSEEEEEDDEDTSGHIRGEAVTQEPVDVETQREGSVVGRNACLLFSNVNGTPNDEEPSWPAPSQDNVADSSPNGNKGKWRRWLGRSFNAKMQHLAMPKRKVGHPNMHQNNIPFQMETCWKLW